MYDTTTLKILDNGLQTAPNDQIKYVQNVTGSFTIRVVKGTFFSNVLLLVNWNEGPRGVATRQLALLRRCHIRNATWPMTVVCSECLAQADSETTHPVMPP